MFAIHCKQAGECLCIEQQVGELLASGLGKTHDKFGACGADSVGQGRGTCGLQRAWPLQVRLCIAKRCKPCREQHVRKRIARFRETSTCLRAGLLSAVVSILGEVSHGVYARELAVERSPFGNKRETRQLAKGKAPTMERTRPCTGS